ENSHGFDRVSLIICICQLDKALRGSQGLRPRVWGQQRRTLSRRLCDVCAALLFQMLWGRLDIEANGTIRLRDEELASLRPARRFMQILESEVPKTPMEIEQLLRYYSLIDTPLPPGEYDRLIFTSVYCAYQIRSIQGLDKNLWIHFFSQLVDEIFRDLCKGLCPANSTLLMCISPFSLSLSLFLSELS
uniref:F180B protein n=1 Tax=Anas zonorhyncha TaxID=75864 RepID=A0A8B9UDL1_9AVES